MLSKCVAKKRFVYKTGQRINYKLLDLHLLKSETLLDNFGVLNGGEKYYLTRNMVAIYLFLNGKSVSRESTDAAIKQLFNINSVNEIKQNMLDKSSFLQTYKQVYNECFNRIMGGIKNGKTETSWLICLLPTLRTQLFIRFWRKLLIMLKSQTNMLKNSKQVG